ncbi:hypothetical protein PM082_021603 [Marasmius tenuissimus]|nr:hypothetical protein PM082_021603 [Marasmius tenuissimus]
MDYASYVVLCRRALTTQRKQVSRCADVGHPGPGVNRPSLAGVVWSIDRYATSYHATCQIQQPRLERIESLWEMAATAFFYFFKYNVKDDNTSAIPGRVFFFRDGLSEGEFDRVGRMEIEAIVTGFRAAWTRYLKVQERFEIFDKVDKKPPIPNITYVAVGKRHHISFFPERGQYVWILSLKFTRDHELIDYSEALHTNQHWETAKQVYLAIKGTSRSSHYTVVHDENDVVIENENSTVVDMSKCVRDWEMYPIFRREAHLSVFQAGRIGIHPLPRICTLNAICVDSSTGVLCRSGVP